ncbi:MAG: hypothetical protein MNPFHGCM_01018 [Gemmatimonadaceae bacterium]|nr:hypothetical protein [Gemmatimonadaceae bacterium]
MIRSMTGFGAAEGALGSARISVELRSVNHRFFNSTIRLPNEISRWEGEVREVLRRRIVRGHVTLTARLERRPDQTTVIDEARFAAAASVLRTLRERHGLEGAVDIGSVLRMPDVIAGAPDALEADTPTLVSIVEAAVASLMDAREEEGDRLAQYVRARLNIIEEALDRIAARAPERLVESRSRLRENVRQLTEGITVDEQRLAMEIAILADRLDLQEELARFRSHTQAFLRTLANPGGEAVGKRLGFLLQEMLREANTMGSKANDSTIVTDVVTVKEELERIREQVENLE